MSVLTKLTNGCNGWRIRLRTAWYRHQFVKLEGAALARLEMGPGTHFAVPVRSQGQGTLLVGPDNAFGYRAAPLLGDGSILLQPRSPSAVITLGTGNWFSNNVSIVANERVTIGNGCQIGDLVAIYDCDFHELNPLTRNRSAGDTAPVSIGNNVWLGSRVMVLKGVTIGDNSVIGAMSVVTRSIPANSLAIGAPARVVKSLVEGLEPK